MKGKEGSCDDQGSKSAETVSVHLLFNLIFIYFFSSLCVSVCVLCINIDNDILMQYSLCNTPC